MVQHPKLKKMELNKALNKKIVQYILANKSTILNFYQTNIHKV